MAQIQPPETFDFSTPNEWPKWRKRFERYLVEEEATKIDSVLKAFDSHFCVRKNIIHERAKFNSRIQEDREPVDEFITSFGWSRDKALSERMQLDSELTLEKAVKMVRQQEAVRQQQVDLQRPSTSQKVKQVKFNSKKQSPKQQQQPSRKKEKSAKTRSRCTKCGGFTHREGQACRAEGQRCNLCSKTGHFANCCPDKQAKTAEVKAVTELDEEIGFLLEVSAVEDSSNLDGDEGECRRRWTAEIQVNGKRVKFKLDSQADVTCVPLCLFKKIMGQQRLVESDINIRAAEFSELQTVGMFISTLRNGNYEIKEKIYVIRRLSEPLLSRRACEILNLARRIEVVATRINPIKDEMLTNIFEAQQEDTTLKAVVNYLEQGWPNKKKMSQALLSYWHVKDELGILDKLHAGHFGITKARLRARETVWWPGISEEIAETVRKCSVCIQEAVSKHEPLIPTNFPTRPWQKIGMDLFKFENKWYLVVIDYYSRFPIVVQLDRLTANVVVRSCKSIFARHGIPETVVSDNGTQFGAAREFANFARQYGFTHVTSSPRFPQSNGMEVAGVKIAKLILKKNQDPSLGLLEYRSTPLENGYSPAELLMGRKLRTTLPIAPENLNPRLVDSQTLRRKERRRRKDMKSRYDRRCGATDMEELSEGDTVWITDMRTWGIVKQKASTPRSYMVDTPVGTIRRNRFHLRKGVTVQYPADPSTPTFSGEELVENEKTPVVDYPSNDSEDGQIRTRTLLFTTRVARKSRACVVTCSPSSRLPRRSEVATLLLMYSGALSQFALAEAKCGLYIYNASCRGLESPLIRENNPSQRCMETSEALHWTQQQQKIDPEQQLYTPKIVDIAVIEITNNNVVLQRRFPQDGPLSSAKLSQVTAQHSLFSQKVQENRPHCSTASSLASCREDGIITISTDDSDDILEGFVVLEDLQDTTGNVVVLMAHHIVVHDMGGGTDTLVYLPVGGKIPAEVLARPSSGQVKPFKVSSEVNIRPKKQESRQKAVTIVNEEVGQIPPGLFCLSIILLDWSILVQVKTPLDTRLSSLNLDFYPPMALGTKKVKDDEVMSAPECRRMIKKRSPYALSKDSLDREAWSRTKLMVNSTEEEEEEKYVPESKGMVGALCCLETKIDGLEQKYHSQLATAFTVSAPHVCTRPCGHASRELPSFSPLANGITSRMATNLARAESPSNAEQKPVRHGAKAQPCAELSKKEDFQKKTSNLFNKNQNYANPPAGGHHANPATPTNFVTASFSEAAAQANRSWADLAEDNNLETEDPFITVQRKKRRRGSAESPAAAAPSSNIRGAGAIRRPRSSTGWAPRAEEIRTTRAHIVEARARQASSTEDHCVYVERSPELEPFHYMRAIERMFGGTREVFQLTKMNGHFLVGLANRGMAERLVNEGLEVEGTLHRAFPFRKRAERITVGNLPFFVGDAAVISALSSFGRVTSIAPKLMKAGPYIYNDGRREAFIILREGMTIERLPTRLDITIKGEAWPAYLSSGIRCSRCRGQGHRRANCPLLARRTTAPGPATPTSPTSVPPATAPRLPQQPSAQPPPPASPSPTMEVSDVPPTSRAALHPPAALRQSSPAPSALPAEDAPLAPPPMTPAPSLRTPGSREPAAPTPDVEMSIVEESSASFTSTAKNATRIDLDAFIERHPSVSFAETDALGLGREEVLDLLSSRTKTQRSVPLLPPSQCNALAGLIRQILDLRPGAASNLYKVLGQVKAELRTTPAAVPPTPPLPAPRPAEPMLPTTHREELTPPLMTPPPPAPTDMEEDDPMTEKERDTPPPPAPRLAETIPPIPHGEKTSPHIATPPPPLSCQFIDDRWTEADDILHELNQERDWGVGISESDITEAVIYPEDREPLIRRLSTRRRSLLAGFISAAIERARDADPFVRTVVLQIKKLNKVLSDQCEAIDKLDIRLDCELQKLARSISEQEDIQQQILLRCNELIRLEQPPCHRKLAETSTSPQCSPSIESMEEQQQYPNILAPTILKSACYPDMIAEWR
ncbi:K02A2.6-like [Cordylochernes scorpioides]|uniref:RNA-directed DNA polymerase n=1 Tax=Cordylochernes scorpioides TaxID=51811 RepID=A0ABY6KAX3_9ARAC|nr:K02A2.6-like [Cordylochernes scorpioides]